MHSLSFVYKAEKLMQIFNTGVPRACDQSGTYRGRPQPRCHAWIGGPSTFQAGRRWNSDVETNITFSRYSRPAAMVQ